MSTTLNVVEWRVQQVTTILARTIPARYVNATCDQPDVAAWADEINAGTTTESLLLVGSVGRGKTHQAYGALRHIATAAAQRGNLTVVAAVTHAGLNAEVRPGGDGLDRYLNADLLLLDDLGSAHITSWTADAAYQLIDARWRDMRPTIFTTNVAPDALSEQLGERLTSRLFGMARRVLVTGPDRRRA